MLTQRRTQRKTLPQETTRAGRRVASQARDVASGAGEVARTAKTEIGGLRRLAGKRAGRKVTGARRATSARLQGTSARLQGTAARLSSAAEVVEGGGERQGRGKRRWPRVVALLALVGTAALVVARRVRAVWTRDETGDSAAEPREGAHLGTTTPESDRPESMGQLAEAGDAGEDGDAVEATGSGSPERGTGQASEQVPSGASANRGNGGR
jgi:hypothetical protein